MTIEDFPKIDEYFADMYAFDEVEVETLCEYLETTNKEKEQEKKENEKKSDEKADA